MALLLLCLLASFIENSDQEELIRKFSKEVWNTTAPVIKQELLAQARLIKLLQTPKNESKEEELPTDPWTNVMQHILKPECRNDLK